MIRIEESHGFTFTYYTIRTDSETELQEALSLLNSRYPPAGYSTEVLKKELVKDKDPENTHYRVVVRRYSCCD